MSGLSQENNSGASQSKTEEFYNLAKQLGVDPDAFQTLGELNTLWDLRNMRPGERVWLDPRKSMRQQEQQRSNRA